MNDYTQILAHLQPGQSIARVTEGFQLKEGKAALSIVFPRVESLLMWFDREYPAKQAGAAEAPETGFYPYSLTCSCGRTLEGSTEAKWTAVYCECGQGVAVRAGQDKPEQGNNPNGEFPLVNEDGHNLIDYVPTGWEFIAPEHDYIAIDADGEVFSYLGQPTTNEEHPMWLEDEEFEKVTGLPRLSLMVDWHELIWQRPQK